MTAPRFRLYLAQSLDGFIADERGAVHWLTAYGEPEGYAEFLAETGAIVMGRKSFDQMLSFGPWPYGERRTVVLTHRPLPEGAPAVAEAWSGADVGPLARDLRTTTQPRGEEKGRVTPKGTVEQVQREQFRDSVDRAVDRGRAAAHGPRAAGPGRAARSSADRPRGPRNRGNPSGFGGCGPFHPESPSGP